MYTGMLVGWGMLFVAWMRRGCGGCSEVDPCAAARVLLLWVWWGWRWGLGCVRKCLGVGLTGSRWLFDVIGVDGNGVLCGVIAWTGDENRVGVACRDGGAADAWVRI